MEDERVLIVACFLSLFLLVLGQDDIRQPPRISKPATPRQEFFLPNNANNDIFLNCSATGRPLPSYDWYYNAMPIQPQLGDITVDHTTGALTIRKPTTAIQGYFSCRARTTFPNGVSALSISHSVEVRAARLDNWQNKEPGEQIAAKEGEYVSIRCDDNRPQSIGPSLFKWFKNVDVEFQEVLDDERIFIDNTGTLHFTYAQTHDTQPGYACAVTNVLVGNIQTGRRHQLTVSAVSSVPEARPILQFSTETNGQAALTFKANDRGRLECVFSGYVNVPGDETPSVAWFDNANNPIVSGRGRYTIENSGRVLLIDSLREADDKLYTCQGSNTLGSTRATMQLNVTAAPIWVEPLQSTTVPQGQDAVFHCQARSAVGEVPPDPPRWRRNGISMNSGYDPNKYEFSEGRRVLTVKATRKNADIACFQCYVGNSVGDSYGEGCLNVILPIQIITRPAAKQSIDKKGDIVDLTVVATSDNLYPLAYTWYFNNVTYDSLHAPPHVIYDVNTNLAYINTSDLTDQQMRDIRGVYRRQVYHEFETVFVDMEVDLLDDPLVVAASAGTFDFWIVGLVLGLLLLLLVLLIVLFIVVRRKRQEGHYPVDKNETKAGLDPKTEMENSGFDALTRAPYDYPENSRSRTALDIDDLPREMEGDNESFGSSEYGDEASAFNEDGSFIGVYSSPERKPPVENNVHPTGESVV
ncbi:neural cell adhesion molecule L1-like [Littorina saxatilis]|uniref:Ig-like domain-containing protein n=1 Tax=Littorina saxatilis TaxID=31220 RepID=A0AAN9AQD2_9CAEN